jgi:hypothetical protein
MGLFVPMHTNISLKVFISRYLKFHNTVRQNVAGDSKDVEFEIEYELTGNSDLDEVVVPPEYLTHFFSVDFLTILI